MKQFLLQLSIVAFTLVTALFIPSIGAAATVYKNCFGGTCNLLSLYNTAGLSANWNTVNPAEAPDGIYRLVVANSTGCTDTAYTVITIDIKRSTGNKSNNWHERITGDQGRALNITTELG